MAIGHQRPLIKICGVTTPADAAMVAGAGADWIGINFHPASKRFVAPDRAAELVAAIGDRAEAVGLFVDRPADEVAMRARQSSIAIVQLHGEESAESVARLRDEGLRVVRAFRLAGAASIAAMDRWLDQLDALGASLDAVLVDAFVPGREGGTGRVITDEVLGLLPTWACGERPRLILAGGLTPENVAELVVRVRPWMVDVASGVESRPGRKDGDRAAAFVRSVRAAWGSTGFVGDRDSGPDRPADSGDDRAVVDAEP